MYVKYCTSTVLGLPSQQWALDCDTHLHMQQSNFPSSQRSCTLTSCQLPIKAFLRLAPGQPQAQRRSRQLGMDVHSHINLTWAEPILRLPTPRCVMSNGSFPIGCRRPSLYGASHAGKPPRGGVLAYRLPQVPAPGACMETRLRPRFGSAVGEEEPLPVGRKSPALAS